MKKIFSNYPFGVISIFFIFGIILQIILNFSFIFLTCLFFLSIISHLLLRKSVNIHLLLLVIFLIMGSTNFKIWFQNNLQHPLEDKSLSQPVRLICTVLDPPVKDRKTLLVKLNQITLSDLKVEIQRKFILRTSYFIPNLLPGDVLNIDQGILDQLAGPRNPGQFDYKSLFL